MPYRLFLSATFACVIAGCASSGPSMVPEAEPLAPEAVKNADGLAEYLEASGIELLLVESRPDLVRPRVTRSTLLEFALGGGCEVLTYETAEDAEQIGPRSGGGGTYTRRTPGLATGDFTTVRSRYKPTYRFGPLVVACSGEDPLVDRALRSLEQFAESDA